MSDFRTLSEDEVRPFLSPYLAEGWKEDAYRLHSIEVSNDTIRARCDMTSFAASHRGFHFTVPVAFLCISQLAIIGICLEEGLHRKEGEVLLRDIQIKCRRELRESRDVPLRLTLARKVAANGLKLYLGDYAVGGDAFIGAGKFVMLPPEATAASVMPLFACDGGE